MHSTFEPLITDRDKMPFEVEPVYLKLTYFKTPAAPASPSAAAPANPTPDATAPPADATAPPPAAQQPAPAAAPTQ
jgi:hypothetical protein